MNTLPQNPASVRPANYVRHLNAFLRRVESDLRLGPAHVSLYMELFHLWNIKRFQNPIRPSPNLSVNISKIRSRTTYRNTLKELRDFGYIRYSRSSKNTPAIIEMVPLDGQDLTIAKSISDQSPESICSVAGQNPTNTPYSISNSVNMETSGARAPGPSSGNIKDVFPGKTGEQSTPGSLEETIEFFRSNGSDIRSAEVFFHHYDSIGWKLSGFPITNWQAAARKWIARPPFGNTKQKPHNTHVNTNKNYHEGL